MSYVIGADGGGTKTDLILCDTQGHVLERVLLGGSNPNDIGLNRAAVCLLEGIGRLAPAMRPGAPATAFFGISGGMAGRNRERLRQVLAEKLDPGIRFETHSDVINVLNCGTDGRDGGVLIAGTGMIACLRKGAQLFRAGGYGYLLDRGGSGYDFGRDALYHTLCVMDGLEPPSLLAGLVEEKTGGLFRNLDDIYAGGRARIASFAPLVFAAYAQGDSTAAGIIRRGAQETAKLLNRLAVLSGQAVCEVVLAGSVFRDFSVLEPFLTPHMRHRFKFIFPAVDPVYGAALEAARLNPGIDQQVFQQNLKQEMEDSKWTACLK